MIYSTYIPARLLKAAFKNTICDYRVAGVEAYETVYQDRQALSRIENNEQTWLIVVDNEVVLASHEVIEDRSPILAKYLVDILDIVGVD